MKTEILNRKWTALLTIILATFNIAILSAQSGSVVSRSVVIRSTIEAKEFDNLPKKFNTIKHDGVTYYETKGRYLVPTPTGFQAVVPPAGTKISSLPKGALSFKILDQTYYNLRGVIYKGSKSGGYETVCPEVGMTITEMPDTEIKEVVVDGQVFLETGGFVYKSVLDGEQYVVVCTYDSLVS